MNNIIDTNYINQKDKNLVKKFTEDKIVKKYILGINKLTKSIKKYIDVDGIVDDFSRQQTSRKKNILQIEDIPKGAIILWVSLGSPLEVKNKLDELGFENFSYLSFYKYSKFDLVEPPFIVDFEDDFKTNYEQYKKTFLLLNDKKSKEIFTKIINFKISFDFEFMQGFTNNHEEQYFDKDLIPSIKDISFVDGGGYIGDTLPQIIDNFPDFKKIYLVEPSKLHIKIAQENFSHVENIKYINKGLGLEQINVEDSKEIQNNCDHHFQATSIDSIDNLIKDKIDFIKLDIEGAEQDALNGAKYCIAKYTPILAICIYHKAEDWYKIPQIVLNINSSYDIYIRHYMEGIYETVMYFIPKKT